MTISKFLEGMKSTLVKTMKYWLLKYCMYSMLFHPLNSKYFRQFLWRIIGCTVGKNTYIGYGVAIDVINAKYIKIEDRVSIANQALLLCHLRNLDNYYISDEYMNQPYKKIAIHIKKGATVGMRAIILPGVTIGEGSVVGAGSIVTKDVLPWTIVAGNPAKVIKIIKVK